MKLRYLRQYSDCDCRGWATRFNTRCDDGLTISKNAFGNQSVTKVPVCWNHLHNDPDMHLGHAFLEKVPGEGYYAYVYLNNTPKAKTAKELLRHGDIDMFSIWASNIERSDNMVTHGILREVSLVTGGKNPKAVIESSIYHGESMEDGDDEIVIFSMSEIKHSFTSPTAKKKDDLDIDEDSEEDDDENDLDIDEDSEEDDDENDLDIDEDSEEDDDENDLDIDEDSEEDDVTHSATAFMKRRKDKSKTVKEILNGMTEEQKLTTAIVAEAYAEKLMAAKTQNKTKKEEKSDMKKKDVRHSIFDEPDEVKETSELPRDIMRKLVEEAKNRGTFSAAIKHCITADEELGETLAHAIDTTGMTVPATEGAKAYGIRGLEYLVPDPKAISATPYLVSRDMGWVDELFTDIGTVPFKRIKTIFADITEDEARAKGYITGNVKRDEVLSLLKRVTEPQTVYKKQKFDRDDLLDLAEAPGLDMLAWIKSEMNVMLREEVARGILIGDGRQDSDPDKIKEDRIRPIATDVPFFNITVKVTVPNDATDADIADAAITAIIKAFKKYKGSGSPKFWSNKDYTTEMLLLKDKVGHPLYKTSNELATALRVSKIVDVEPMSNYSVKITEDGTVNSYPLIGIVTALRDYRIGETAKDKTTMFSDFDIDVNQEKYLLERRLSGAMVRPYSSMTFVLDRQKPAAPGKASSSEKA